MIQPVNNYVLIKEIKGKNPTVTTESGIIIPIDEYSNIIYCEVYEKSTSINPFLDILKLGNEVAVNKNDVIDIKDNNGEYYFLVKEDKILAIINN